MNPEELIQEYETRINQHRFDSVAPLVSEDALFWFSDGTYSGHSAIKSAFEKTWSRIQDENYSIDGLLWVVYEDKVAACTYQYRWRGKIDGVEASGEGRGTTIVRKDSDGWKIIHEHLSAKP